MIKNIYKLFYEKQAADTLVLLHKMGREQHCMRIRSRCLALQIDAEEQGDVKKIHSKPSTYEAFVFGMELDDFEPTEGYQILFRIWSKKIIILKIIYYDRELAE